MNFNLVFQISFASPLMYSLHAEGSYRAVMTIPCGQLDLIYLAFHSSTGSGILDLDAACNVKCSLPENRVEGLAQDFNLEFKGLGSHKIQESRENQTNE